MKRILSLLTAVLVLLTLAACGGEQSAATPSLATTAALPEGELNVLVVAFSYPAELSLDLSGQGFHLFHELHPYKGRRLFLSLEDGREHLPGEDPSGFRQHDFLLLVPCGHQADVSLFHVLLHDGVEGGAGYGSLLIRSSGSLSSARRPPRNRK